MNITRLGKILKYSDLRYQIRCYEEIHPKHLIIFPANIHLLSQKFYTNRLTTALKHLTNAKKVTNLQQCAFRVNLKLIIELIIINNFEGSDILLDVLVGKRSNSTYPDEQPYI